MILQDQTAALPEEDLYSAFVQRCSLFYCSLAALG